MEIIIKNYEIDKNFNQLDINNLLESWNITPDNFVYYLAFC